MNEQMEGNMLDNEQIIKWKEREHPLVLMDEYILENMKTIKNMAMEYFNGRMVESMKDNELMENKMD